VFATTFCVVVGTAAIAQNPTLRDRVASAHGNVYLHINVDGPIVTMQQMLAETDVVVRGLVGPEVARLSANERAIMTTYELVNPQVSFSKTAVQANRPGIVPRAISLTQPGGTVAIGEFTATVEYDSVPRPRSGMELIALLTDRQGQYFAAAGIGLFEVREVRIVPIGEGAEIQRFRGMSRDAFLEEVVRLRKGANR
jgi:hypothetical protein